MLAQSSTHLCQSCMNEVMHTCGKTDESLSYNIERSYCNVLCLLRTGKEYWRNRVTWAYMVVRKTRCLNNGFNFPEIMKVGMDWRQSWCKWKTSIRLNLIVKYVRRWDNKSSTQILYIITNIGTHLSTQWGRHTFTREQTMQRMGLCVTYKWSASWMTC